jgi:3-methyladenine DNA glycosylase/8-oxoguanine DNA glycosylase
MDIAGEAIDQAITRELVATSRAMLRLDEDLAEFHALCRRVSWLAPIPRLGVGRLMRGSSLWEDVVKAVSWTNTTWAQAVKMVSRIATLGDPCPAAPGLRAWPTPTQLVQAGLPFLRQEAKLGYRAAYLINLAREVQTGKIDLDDLDKRARALQSSHLARELMTIKGVGPASAAYLLSMLGHYDHLIVDSATRAFIARRFFKGQIPEGKAIERPFSPLGHWRGLGLWFGFWLSRKSGTRG